MTIPTTSSVAPMSSSGRRAVIGAWMGLFVDMFDVYLPIIVLAPAMAYFQPASLSPNATIIISAMVFAATLLGRPVGAMVFGHFSDTAGRRNSTLIAATGFGLTTLAIALLPGYDSLGVTAIVLLIVLRFVDGFFLGGQYTAAMPSAFEQCHKDKRGWYGALIMTAFPLAYCAIALMTFLMLQVVPSHGLDSPYVQWGWRIPFVVGAVLAFAYVAWYRRMVPESAAWQSAPKAARPPLLELFRGGNRGRFLQVFTLMSGVWLAFNMIGAVLPALLKSRAGLSDLEVTATMTVSYAVLAVAYLGAGLASQRFGRRPFLLAAGFVTALVAPALYGLIVSRAVTSNLALMLLTALLVVATVSVFGVVATYINERFHVGVRSSAYGLGYTAAVIIPSFYAFFQTGLSSVIPYSYTPLVLVAFGGALICLGAAIGPETRDADMTSAADTPALALTTLEEHR